MTIITSHTCRCGHKTEITGSHEDSVEWLIENVIKTVDPKTTNICQCGRKYSFDPKGIGHEI